MSTLKKQRITLKSLKRKQIDDNFQIFKDERKRRIRCNYRLSISMDSSHLFSDSDSDNDSDMSNCMSSGSIDNDINTSRNTHKSKSKRNKQTLSKTTINNGNDDDYQKSKRKGSDSHLASTVPTLPVLSSASSSFCCS